MAEATEYLGKEDKGAEVKGFINKFTTMKFGVAKELRGKLQSLDLMKLRSGHISKIIDLMPESAEELNKIFPDVGLDEDETKKILDTIKEYK